MLDHTANAGRQIVIGAILVLVGMTGCPGDDIDIDFECDEHEHCLDDEACLGEFCHPAPVEGDDCPDEYTGEEYDDIGCVAGEWIEVPGAPQIGEITAEPQTPEPEESVDLVVDVESELDVDELEFAWNVVEGEGWQLEADDESVAVLIASAKFADTATIEVEVTDPFGSADTVDTEITTWDGEGPIVGPLEVDPEMAMPGETQTVTAVVEHPNELEIEDYDWSISEEWQADGELDGEEIAIVAPDEPDEEGAVELVVTDEAGNTDEGSVDVATVQNPGPQVDELYATAGSEVLELGETVELTIHVSHELDFELDGDGPLEVAIDGHEDWELESESIGGEEEDALFVELMAPERPDEFADIEVTVRDIYGGTDDESIQLQTISNPGADITIEGPGEPSDPRDLVTVSAEITHPQEFVVEKSNWTLVDNDDEWTISGGSEGEDLRLRSPAVPDSQVVAEITVTDEFGKNATESITVETRENVDPVIEKLVWGEDEEDAAVVDPDDPDSWFQPGEQKQITVEADHEFNFDLDYQWGVVDDNTDWSITDGQTESTVTVTAPDDSESEVGLRIEVQDDFGGSAEDDVGLLSRKLAIVDVHLPAMPVERGTSFGVKAEVFAPGMDLDDLDFEWRLGDADEWGFVDNDPTGQEVEIEAPDLSAAQTTLEVVVSDGDGLEDQDVIVVRTHDYEPEPFSFENQDGVEPHDDVISDAVQIEGITTEVSASCDNCQLRYRESGNDEWSGWQGAFDSEIADGSLIEIKQESGTYDQQRSAVAVVGDTDSDAWTVTTKPWEGERELTTCGASGRVGPETDDCKQEYAGTPLEDEVGGVEEPGLQVWRVPADGVYTIEALGAEGGMAPADGTYPPRGASAQVDIRLNRGERLGIIVGQRGNYEADPSLDSESASGGGGSFVLLGDEPVVIGGGGGGDIRSHEAGRDGSSSTAGNAGTGVMNVDGEGGEWGGAGTTGGANAGGGGGLVESAGKEVGGRSYQDELTLGGFGEPEIVEGGFGSGGGAVTEGSEHFWCGGGGGFSGGSAAANRGLANFCNGGGGGSFACPAEIDDEESERKVENFCPRAYRLIHSDGVTGAVNDGDGRVIIDWDRPE